MQLQRMIELSMTTSCGSLKQTDLHLSTLGCQKMVFVKNVGLGCYWFSSLLQEFFSRPLGFSPSTKKHSKFQFEWETVDKRSHLVECLLLNSHLLIPICLLI